MARIRCEPINLEWLELNTRLLAMHSLPEAMNRNNGSIQCGAEMKFGVRLLVPRKLGINPLVPHRPAMMTEELVAI